MLNEMTRRPPHAACYGRAGRRGSEAGAIAIMTPFIILALLAMFGMALDLSRNYNRKIELQGVADSTALAAAAALDGTTAGIDKAISEAALTASNFNYSYNNYSVTWSNAALTFGTDANGTGGWVDATAARANASKMYFARVDTSSLAASHGIVQNFFIVVVSSSLAQSNVAGAAVAGRDTVNVLPFAICANSNTTASALASGELVEYGFRRGVSYNLMNLNPSAGTPENFLVNPIAPPGVKGSTMKTRMDVVAPYVCTGRMAMPSVMGGDITVERGFPIASLYVHLNSRFGSYVNPCVPSTAPADPNTKSFDLTNVTWMKNKPDGQSANPLTLPNPLLTVAEKPATATKTAYGPLWSYAKAVKYASYTANGGVEPTAGYATFGTTDWNTVYAPGQPEASTYPSPTPYQATGGSSTYKSYRNTRVLRVPLLQCPVPAGALTTARVVGIGKFFMTVPASASALYAEFAGMDSQAALGGIVRLYR